MRRQGPPGLDPWLYLRQPQGSSVASTLTWPVYVAHRVTAVVSVVLWEGWASAACPGRPQTRRQEMNGKL